jgi:hypothetical protein
MNFRGFGIAILAIALCATVNAQARNEDWVGIWHANAGGQPTGALTLATDTGVLGGTVVLDIICCEGETPHVIASDPHVLINPQVAGNMLTFQVKMRRPNGGSVDASFEVKRTAADKATIHCTTCGSDAPVVELVKGL